MIAVRLVELIATTQFPRAVAFPFIQGFLRQRGLPVRWVRFATPAPVRADPPDPGYGLPPEEVGSLKRILSETPVASHVLFSHEPSRGLMEAVREVCPAARIAFVCDQDASENPRVEPVFPDVPGVCGFVGLESDGPPNLFEEADPDFAFEAGNEAASAAAPLPFLIVGEECSYRRPLSWNPDFAGLALEGCDVSGGCTFCVRPAHPVRWTHPVEEVMRRQIAGIERAYRDAPGRLLVRVVGEPFLKHVRTFAAIVAPRALPPCDFLLDGRSDWLLARERDLELALEALSSTPHRLEVALVGLENFSESELRRMNKGTTAVQNLDVVRLLLRLERDHPAGFGFRRWGGFSLILQTPWTRIEDLVFNLSVLDAARIEQFSGKVFSSRLRLYPSLPLYRLAERDGLVLRDYRDPRLDTTRSQPYAMFYRPETPWRFQDPRLEPVSSILARMAVPPSPDDPVHEALSSAFRRLGRDSYGIGFAMAVCDAACATDRVLDPADLIRAAVDLQYTNRPAWSFRPPAHLRPPLDPISAVQFTLLAVRAGVKPAARLEGDAAQRWLQDAARLRAASGLAVQELDDPPSVFLGRDAATVAQVAEAARRQRDPQAPESERTAALIEEGRLLGYPDCCVHAFCQREGAIRDSYVWLHVLRRIEEDAEVSPLFNPGFLPLVEHVPCSLRCRESLERASRSLEAYRDAAGQEAARDLLEALEHPWLFLVEADGQRVELIPESEPSDRFRYRPGAWAGGHRLVQAVLAGDELVVNEVGVQVCRRGRLIAAMGCRAFLWWHRRVFQRDLWARILALRFDPRLEDRRDEPQQAPQALKPAGYERACRLAAFVFKALGRGEGWFEGFRVVSVEPGPGVSTRVCLAAGSDRIVLQVEPARPGTRVFARIGPYALLHPDGVPLDTPAKVRAARAVAARLRAAVSKARTPH